jgi:hypothetical protein
VSAWWLLAWGAAAGYALAKVEASVRNWREERAKTEACRIEQARLTEEAVRG